MPNFGKYFLQGFNQTFNPTFQNVLNDLQIKRRQDEQRQFLIDQQNAELQQEQQQKNLAYDLASGREPDVLGQILGQPQVPFTDTTRMITPDRQGDILRQLDKTGLQYYGTYDKLLNPKKEKDEYTNLDFSQPDAVYGFNKRTQTFEKVQDYNPVFKKPKVNRKSTTTGWSNGDWGRKQIFITYEDGTTETVDTPFYKEKGKSGGGFNYDEYKKDVYAKYNELYAKHNAAMEKYLVNSGLTKQDLTSGKEKLGAVGNYINKQIDEDELKFYESTMPEAQSYINRNYYNNPDIQQELFGTLAEGGVENPEYVGSQIAKETFIEKATQDYKEGNIDVDWSKYPKPKGVEKAEWERRIMGDIYGSIILWAKLKMSRL